MMHTVRSRIAMLAASGIASLLMFCAPASAQSDYPNRPIKMLVPGAAGGGMDVMARLVANHIAEKLKQPVVVDNRTGAAGNIAVNLAAKSPPDGYTIVLGQTSQLAINPTLYGNLPYDPIKDFIPILLLADAPNVVVVQASSPLKTLADVVEAAKKSADGLDFATPGVGTVSQLAAEQFQRTANIKLRHIPYKGATGALTDVAGGRVPFMMSSIPTALGAIQGGQLRPIAVSALKRSPVLPDVPTIAEQGYPGFDAGTWYGLLVPAGTPPEVVARLNEAANDALKVPDIAKRVASEGGAVIGGTSETFAAKLRDDNAKWSMIIKEAGIKME